MIPKIIHFCWFSKDEFPDSIKKCIQSWKKYMPDYEIKLWTTSNFDIKITSWTEEAFEMKKWAFVADYFRFWVLYNYGGIYLDSDVEVKKSFSSLLNNKSFFGYEYGTTPEAAVIGSEKGIDWLNDMLDYYKDKHFVLSDNRINGTVLPRHIMVMFKDKYGIDLYDNNTIKKYVNLDLVVYPYYYFSPKNFYDNGKIVIDNNTYSIHHFSNSWTSRKDIPYTYKYHNIVIKLIGKRFHDILIYLIRKGRS